MRKLFFVLAIVLAMFVVACKPKLDVVGGRQPVSTALADVQPSLGELARMPAAQRAEYLRIHHSDLGQRLAYYLRQRGKIQPGTEVQGVGFFFGSLDKVKAEDGTGKTNEGYLKDQLVARVRVSGQKAPIDVIVLCLNGIFELPGDLVKAGMTNLGIYAPVERFTIGRNDNIVRHVGYRLAIDLAERHRLELVRGKGKDRQKITPAEARRLESETDRVQVAAMVFEGDRFDLVAGTYTPAPKKQSPPKRRSGKIRRK